MRDLDYMLYCCIVKIAEYRLADLQVPLFAAFSMLIAVWNLSRYSGVGY